MNSPMTEPVPLVEVTRGPFVECIHRGHAVVCTPDGGIVAAWGDPGAGILPRSSAKMIQALPLVESGAARAAGLGAEHLALACASHSGAPAHTGGVARWLAVLGLSEADLRCGVQMPTDADGQAALGDAAPCQLHNNCSGKHAGFLTLARHLGAGPDYVDPDHPVQRAVLQAWSEVTGVAPRGFGIDGCSAPNFSGTLAGFAAAMARFADPRGLGDVRAEAARALVAAMLAHPDLVAGEGRACTGMMRAMQGRAAIKTGAEGVFFAILPGRGLGVALKIEDGATRASECAMAAILVRLGVADPAHPEIASRLGPAQENRRGIVTGAIRPDAAFYAGGRAL
jgi:L-asparaginase II